MSYDWFPKGDGYESYEERDRPVREWADDVLTGLNMMGVTVKPRPNPPKISYCDKEI